MVKEVLVRVVNLNNHFTKQHRQRLVPRAVFHLTCRQTLFDFVKKAVCPAVSLEGSGDSAGLASSPGVLLVLVQQVPRVGELRKNRAGGGHVWTPVIAATCSVVLGKSFSRFSISLYIRIKGCDEVISLGSYRSKGV